MADRDIDCRGAVTVILLMGMRTEGSLSILIMTKHNR